MWTSNTITRARSPKSDSIKFDALRIFSKRELFEVKLKIWNIFNLNFYQAHVRELLTNTWGVKISSPKPSFQWKASLTLSSEGVANIRVTSNAHHLARAEWTNNLPNPLLALNKMEIDNSEWFYDRYFTATETVTELQVIFHSYTKYWLQTNFNYFFPLWFRRFVPHCFDDYCQLETESHSSFAHV